MQRVVLDHEDAVDRLPNLLGSRRRIDAVEIVEGFRGGHVVGRGADAADPGGDLRHVLRAVLEPAELGDLQERAVDRSRVVEEDVDLPVPLQTRSRVDQALRAHRSIPPPSPAGTTRRCSSETAGYSGRTCRPGRRSPGRARRPPPPPRSRRSAPRRDERTDVLPRGGPPVPRSRPEARYRSQLTRWRLDRLHLGEAILYCCWSIHSPSLNSYFTR